MPTLTDKQLHSLARLGAIVRLKELDQEAAELRKMFPGVKKAQDAAPESAAPATKAKSRKRKQRSLASRQAARVRMKLYWAKKRGEAPAEAAAEVAGKAEEKAPATTIPVAKKKKPTKKAKKASRPKAAKRAKKKG